MILFKTSFDHMHFLNQVSNKCFLFYKIPLTVWPLVVTPVHPLGTAGTASRTGTRTRTTAAATLSVHCTELFFFNTLYPFSWTQIEQCCICSTICCVYSPILLPCLFCHLRPSTTWPRMSAPRHPKGRAPAMASMRSGRGSSLSWLPRHVC